MQITIDVEKDDMEKALNTVAIEYKPHELNQITPFMKLAQSVLLAYEAEKNKIQVGDWVRAHQNRVFKVSKIGELFLSDPMGFFEYDKKNAKKLSEPLQELLKKEIG